MEDGRESDAGTVRRRGMVGDDVGDVESNHTHTEVDQEDTDVCCTQGDTIEGPTQVKRIHAINQDSV